MPAQTAAPLSLRFSDDHFAFGSALLGKFTGVSIGRTDLGEVMEPAT